jgi:hypothetical protein
MNYTPGPFTPFPVSGERSETPPPDYDPSHPFTGVELIVSGLPFTSITSAAEHLNQIIRDIKAKGTSLPDLQIVSPSSRQPLDFVYVSLSGALRENPRPDILENVRLQLGAVNGLEARWKVSSGRSDKTRQVYFEIEEGLNPLQIKPRIDNILRQNHYDFQSSYIPNDSNRIFYHLLKKESISALSSTPIRIDNRSYIPRRSRFIQPLFGLEVAVNGVEDAQAAKSMIDDYIQRQYGDASGDPVVRRSRVELDGSVYCAILSTPQITQRFLRDPFTLFKDSGINTSPPQFLYLLNSNGIPPSSLNSRFSSSITFDPSSQRQLDTLTAQCDAMAATVRALADDQKVLSHNFQTAQQNISWAFADSTAVYAATNLVSTAQAELTSLQQSLTTLQLMSLMAPNPQAQNAILDSVASLTSRIETATTTRDSRALELRSLQSRSLPMMPFTQIPDLAPQVTPMVESNLTPVSSVPEPPSSSPTPLLSPAHKRPRHFTEEQEDAQEDAHDARQVATQMLVDPPSLVCYVCLIFLLAFFTPLVILCCTAVKERLLRLWSVCFLAEDLRGLLHLFHILLPFPSPVSSTVLFSLSLSMFIPLSFSLFVFVSLPRSLSFPHSTSSSPSVFLVSQSALQNIFPFRLSQLSSFFLFFLILSSCYPATLAMPPGGPVSFLTLSLNANGLADPMKLTAIRTMIHTTGPHAFVIGETKSSEPVSSRLELHDYDLHENPGRPLGTRGKGKWGVILGIRRGMFNIQPVPLPHQLRGRVVALDLTIPTDLKRGFRHRLVGIYAPWNPGGTAEDENVFWPEVAHLCNSSSFSWSIHGDFNATLLATESTSAALDISPSRLAYSHFLASSDGIDLWQTQPDNDVTSQYTYCTRRTSATLDHTYSIIDRSAVSRAGILAGSISVLAHFVPSTDHRPIISHVTLLSPASVPGHPDIPQEVPPSAYSPRFRHPFRSETFRFTLFSSKVDDLLSAHPSSANPTPISSDNEFQLQYDNFTQVLLTAAKATFNLPTPHPQVYRKIINPTISLILCELRHINRLLALISRSSHSGHLRFPGDLWATQYFNAYLASSGELGPNFLIGLKAFLSGIRKKLHKLRFAEERLERRKQMEVRSRSRIQQVLHGSSAKRLYPHKISSLPLAITPNPESEPDLVLTGDHEIKEATVNYFQTLYNHTPRAPQAKPWLTTPSVSAVFQNVSSDPFLWPKILSLQEFRTLLRKGNARPTPGPDGWEKWFLKHLSDSALEVVLRLVNYIIVSSHVPSSLKPTNISTIHKRGPNTTLTNYRGIACSNFLLNLPFAWLNTLLTPYLTKHSVIPESQIATQPGTQGRDLIAFISQYECWASREHIPLYVLQRDQKKGFDMLEPEGFYDALTAYGLPRAIADLDRSAQEDVPYRVKTAYGFTDPFIVNGVTKQGGSLSPLKCTLTTSLCNRWISDRRQDSPGSFVVSTHSARIHQPHTPPDRIKLEISMIEAMDDSLLLSSDLPSLKRMAWDADRFQATYGWETAWPKSALYTFNAPPPSLFEARMPSVDYTNPQTGSLSWHEVPVVTSHTTFLRVPVNRPLLQFSLLRDLILNFSFPPSTLRLPLTVLRRILVQTLISKIRPHLSLQPISLQHATTLDHMIAQKVHEYLGFPFRFRTLLLTTPLNLRGLGFPSIARLNASLAVAGLHRDLNHHLPSFLKMAHITLADWTCKHNHCIHPLAPPYTKSKTSPSRQSYIPFSWALSQRTLSRVTLSLLPTDLSYIASGDVSLRHLYLQSIHLLPHAKPVPARVLSKFEDNGYSLLSHFGSFHFSFSSTEPSFVFTPFSLSFPSSLYFLTRDLPLLLDWFTLLPSLLQSITSSNTSLLFSPSDRQVISENSILALAIQSTAFTHRTPPYSFATDASTIQFDSPPYSSTTFAVVANDNAFTASLSPSRTMGILHGEVYAIAAASVIARLQPHPVTIHSDHLNSIRLLSSNPSLLSLKNNPARSLYRWILDIWKSMPHTPLLSHVRAHTSSLSIPAQLNRLADYLASTSNSLPLPPPSLPFPTFFMDMYVPFSPSFGFVESSLSAFCDSRLSILDATSLETFHEPTPSPHCFDDIPPPPYPYTKAPSSYSMVIQLYIRSGQLDTSLTRAARLKDDPQPWCRFGCQALEDPHHIFVLCPHFTPLRTLRASELHSSVDRILETSSVLSADRLFILDRVDGLFLDSNAWPAGRSLFYLGLLPVFFPRSLHHPRIHTRLAHECHTFSIRLAAQIWASARCALFSNSHSSSRARLPSITLPPFLSRILPPSPSYSSFSVTFA